ncbi:neuropeptide CCHamide-1 receptor-like [Acanthaster planci]|uniref:Neuropeptide CCHamide-1 receptor-like n=1 Tax=Acanthaster planci TaxID=133434 RepID=A0A8B7YHV7_ACAPL|nr:neuropeptide CCHamide-1 receptor-like [Acanthaster planci]XP_022091207.1 neuropeptide CCHamide-1 receptor-like [Acanthaster planci]
MADDLAAGTTAVSYQSEYVSPSVPALLSLLGSLGFVGNVCMVHAIAAHRKMRTVPNLLILNIAVACQVYLLLPVPFYVGRLFNSLWDVPNGLCKFEAYLAAVAGYVSVFALTVLSWDRHEVLSLPKEARHKETSYAMASSQAMAMWLGAAVLALPSLVFGKVDFIAGVCRFSTKPDETSIKQGFEILRFLIGYAFPLIIMASYYLKIAVNVYCGTDAKRFPDPSDATVSLVRDRERLTVTALIVSVFFTVCWLPYFSYFMLLAYFAQWSQALRDAALIMPIVNMCLTSWLVFAVSSRHRECLCSGWRSSKD